MSDSIEKIVADMRGFASARRGLSVCDDISEWADRLASLRQVPEGFVLVPREPTDEMLASVRHRFGWVAREDCWRGMVEAAPAMPGNMMEVAPYKAGDRVEIRGGKVAVVTQCWNAVGGWRVLAKVIGEERTPHRGIIDFPVSALNPVQPTSGDDDYCAACKGSGEVDGYEEHPSGDPQDAYMATLPCPQCDGMGVTPPVVPAGSVVFQGTTASLQSAYFGEWSAALAWAGKNGSVTMHTVRTITQPTPAQAETELPELPDDGYRPTESECTDAAARYFYREGYNAARIAAFLAARG